MHFTVNSLAVIVILFSDSANLNQEALPIELILFLIIGIILIVHSN
ncbi:hypothetical protein [Anaerocellum diazotrophicum]|uniref:Uncharacterized protein n=1 Tax=Caldicellulosiruptor diazotrophicus TaxID=2806205 RepID=A0ABM7NQ80_9FIRM|nr:hypothetical protein [Caldicellulosiruptor diazotrophicus]BCS82292.1 hypothetical protein CaldiYA01_22520 [Caldicellulosiruptor diazotrophicus]